MHSMKHQDTLIIGGVDYHPHTHTGPPLGQAAAQLGALITSAPQELRDQLASRKTIRGKAALCRRLRPSTNELSRPAHAAKFALRSIAQRIGALDDEIAVLDRQLEQLVRVAAPRT